MKNVWAQTGLITLSLMISACRQTGEDPGPSLSACHVLQTNGGVEQFSFLQDTIGDARIVQMGENTHGIDNYTQLKAAAFKALHQQAGFDVLFLESAVYQCDEADRHLSERPAETSLLRCAYGVWHTPAMVALFD